MTPLRIPRTIALCLGTCSANEIGEKSAAAEVKLLLANLSIEEGHPSAGEVSAREALATFRVAKMPELELQSRATLAESLLAQAKLSQARQEIARGKPLAAKTQQRLVRVRFDIATALVQAASGRPSDLQAARTALEAMIQETQRTRVLSGLFEARFALGDIEIKYGNRAGAASPTGRGRKRRPLGWICADREQNDSGRESIPDEVTVLTRSFRNLLLGVGQ